MKAPTKYKGISIITTQEVFGSLIESLTEDYIFTQNERLVKMTLESKTANEKIMISHQCKSIEKGSAKAFTGYFDKNKKEIYEDDLVEDDHGNKFKVIWHQQGCKWYLDCYKSIETKTNDMSIMVFESQDLGNGYLTRKDIKIIKE